MEETKHTELNSRTMIQAACPQQPLRLVPQWRMYHLYLGFAELCGLLAANVFLTLK